MRKWSLALVAFGVLFLAACHSQTPPVSQQAARTKTVLKQKDNLWAEVATVSAMVSPSGQLSAEKAKKDTTLTPWISDRGVLYQVGTYKPTASYAAIKQHAKKEVVVPKDYHVASIKQINATLAAMGAKTTIKHYRDLVYLAPSGGTTTTQIKAGFLIEGSHLYVVNIDYTNGTAAAPVVRGTVYSNHYQYAASKRLKPDAVSGLWQSTTGQLAMVRDQQVVTIQDGAFVRGQLEDLSKQKVPALYQNTSFVLRQSQAAKLAVKIGRNSLASGDLWGNLYVFLSPTKMVQVTNGSVIVYTKQSTQTTSSQFPEQVFTVFDKLDAQQATNVAAYILPKGNNTYSVGMATSNDYITVNYAGGLAGAEAANLSGDTLTVGADMNHN
ncbi:hypothetical protein ACFQ3L_09285 [Lacticaseibacillus jixianensis]|uniref:Lipoprotein n=1 Tax=Lacticaseibacillus jixianensis TaxID=2486012 RepID=A0ABW4BDY7_9LACO|nr:hypothetical protein [Lacticaseibacillus jixianensis]